MKRSELCLESKESQLLPYSQLLEWPSGLLPDGGATMSSGGGGEPLPKDEKGLKGWIRNKHKALAFLLGKLGMKAAEITKTISYSTQLQKTGYSIPG